MKADSTPLKGILLSADMGFFYLQFIRQIKSPSLLDRDGMSVARGATRRL